MPRKGSILMEFIAKGLYYEKYVNFTWFSFKDHKIALECINQKNRCWNKKKHLIFEEWAITKGYKLSKGDKTRFLSALRKSKFLRPCEEDSKGSTLRVYEIMDWDGFMRIYNSLKENSDVDGPGNSALEGSGTGPTEFVQEINSMGSVAENMPGNVSSPGIKVEVNGSSGAGFVQGTSSISSLSCFMNPAGAAASHEWTTIDGTDINLQQMGTSFAPTFSSMMPMEESDEADVNKENAYLGNNEIYSNDEVFQDINSLLLMNGFACKPEADLMPSQSVTNGNNEMENSCVGNYEDALCNEEFQAIESSVFENGIPSEPVCKLEQDLVPSHSVTHENNQTENAGIGDYERALRNEEFQDIVSRVFANGFPNGPVCKSEQEIEGCQLSDGEMVQGLGNHNSLFNGQSTPNFFSTNVLCGEKVFEVAVVQDY